MAVPRGILPFAAWKDMVGAASATQFRRDPRVRVADPDRFKQMKAYVSDLYAEIEAESSYEDTAGTVFDCIPIEQQPSLRGHSGPLPQAPDLRPLFEGETPESGPPVAAEDA